MGEGASTHRPTSASSAPDPSWEIFCWMIEDASAREGRSLACADAEAWKAANVGAATVSPAGEGKTHGRGVKKNKDLTFRRDTST